MVFCYQNCNCNCTVRKNCSSDWEKLLKFQAEGGEFAKFLRSLEQFIQTLKGQNKFWQQNSFLTCSGRFFSSNILGQLKLKLGNTIGIQNSAGKTQFMSLTFLDILLRNKAYLGKISKLTVQTFAISDNSLPWKFKSSAKK